MMVIRDQIRLWLVPLMLLLILGRCSVKVCRGQSGGVVWSEPLNLSNSAGISIHPAIVADSYGNTHVFWSEAISEQDSTSAELAATPNTIIYRYWDGQIWAEPVDILAAGDADSADFVAAAVDGENHLHLVWTGVTRIYYSSASVAEADLVRAWTTPHVIAYEGARSAYESDIAVDAQGNVHIVYATRGAEAGVFHTVRVHGNQGWELPRRISDSLRDNETTFKEVRVLLDASGRLHTAWSTANTNGYSQAVYYARRETSGLAWDAPVLLADATIDTGFTGLPSLLEYGPDALLLIYVDQGNRGRIERTSTDGGLTWSEPRFILSSMEGVNGFLIPILDRGGGLHLVINMRPSSNQRAGIYYAPRVGLDWSPIVPVAVDAPYGPSAHYTDAVVRLGNEIHVVWTQLGGGEIWHVRGIIGDLEPLLPEAMPEIVEFTPTPTEIGIAIEPEDASSTYAQTSPATPAASAWVPAVAAAISASLLVAVAVICKGRRA